MIIRLLFALAATLVASSAYAAGFCVSTGVELQNALDSAVNNNEDDEIRLTQGTFVPPSMYGFIYNSAEPHTLTLKGGFHSPCMFASESAASSVIDGGGTRNLLFFASKGSVDLRLESLTLLNGRNGSDHTSSPMYIDDGYIDDGNFTNSVVLDRVVVRNTVSSQGTIYVRARGSIVVQNSVFVDNTIQPDGSEYEVARFQSWSSNGPSGGVVFNGNTVANNINASVPGAAEVDILVKDGPVQVTNSIFWGNTGTDLYVADAYNATIQISYSNIGNYAGSSVVLTNSYSIDPAFIGNGNYRLAGNSPLRDLGDNLASGGIGSFDAGGQTRLVFGQVDLGAYEVQDSIFKNGFQ